MKIRTDFVTNSSSSSFIIARNKELTEKQKEVILSYVVKNFLGGDKEITEENLEKEIDGHYNVGKLRKDINRALGEGKKVYKGSVCFEILHIAKLNGRVCGAKRPHSVSEQPIYTMSR